MSADVLRRAAALMRERATAATAGPWQTRDTMHAETVVCDRTGWLGVVSNPATGRDDYGKANAEHIASWHPAVALTVADWLDNEARVVDDVMAGNHTTAVYVGPAFEVARAYLGESA